MLLKHLSLHGYKTFANQTDFLFHRGVTAVVGPNGSGKSNVADAIRWVLGEQAYSDLRVKKTEDLIFSGSATRAKSGMAEVSLTLENPSSLAPEPKTQPEPNGDKPRAKLDPVAELLRANPSEVTIGRRAYRDGENEYFLNGKRVRLRDVVELLERWGLAKNTYAVVGQGLMDQALSLRPEERRAMFEEAAGIGTYENKRNNALDKLEETQSNLLRVNDIINEIAPRLPSLARQAERAKNYAGVVGALDDKLRTHYAFHWGRAQQILNETNGREEESRKVLQGRRKELAELAERLGHLRRQGQELRAKLGEGRRSRTALESEYATRTRELAVLEERVRFTTQQRDDAVEDLAHVQTNLRGLNERVESAEAAVAEKEREHAAIQTRLHEAEQNLAEHRTVAAQFQAVESWLERVRALIRRLARLKDELADPARGLQIARELSEEAAHLAQYEDQQVQSADAVESSRTHVSDLRTALALGERDVASAHAQVQAARASIAQMESDIARRNERIAALNQQVELLTVQRDALNARVEESSRALTQIDESVVPAEAELSGAEQAQIELEQNETRLRAQLGEFEEAHNAAVLEVERARAEIARLEAEIEDDLASGRIIASKLNGEGAESEETTRASGIEIDAARPQVLRLRSGDELAELPIVAAVHEGLEKEIRKLRNQLKYMGAINPNAPQEYEELKARHAFLTEQAEDATRAIESLRKAIAELDEIMRRKFEETFKAVNAEFGNYFTLLFSGGTARLELTQPDDILQTGVDIIARPPGKRATHLAMLSGGERALTAAALLFAVLKVSPTPFCVMDEVDAMLDESNVGRFNDALKSLGTATQFIIITHNRRTIENSDTVYGITMGEDGVSQAISLRLNGSDRAKTTDEAMTIVTRKTRERKRF